MEHTYVTVHKRPLPEHMRQKEVNTKKQKTDQLNFDADDKTVKSKAKPWTPNPNQRKDHNNGPFKHGYGGGGGHPNSNRWNNYPSRGKHSKGKHGKGKSKGKRKGKNRYGKGKGKAKSSKGKHADKICHFCGLKGHIKATCYKHLALQGNGTYQKSKAK